MLAKAHSDIKKKCTANILSHGLLKSLSVGDKVSKKTMTNESHKAKMNMKWTGSYIIVEVSVVGDVNSGTNMGIF